MIDTADWFLLGSVVGFVAGVIVTMWCIQSVHPEIFVVPA